MKAKEIREMSIADLQDRIQVEKNNLDTMKKRKDIARMLTILAAKQNNQ